MPTKNNKTFRIIAVTAFSYPLFMMLFLPAVPRAPWQEYLFFIVTQHLHIVVGLNGPLPFFTVVVSAYLGFWVMIITIWSLINILKKYGVGKKFQQACYQYIDEEIVNGKYTRWLKQHPILLKLYVMLLILFSSLIGFWHLFDVDISFVRGRRGGLLALGYQYKLGVIIWESMFYIFSVFSLVMSFLFGLYIFNILRGLGRGNNIVNPAALDMSQLTKNNNKRLNQIKRRKRQ